MLNLVLIEANPIHGAKTSDTKVSPRESKTSEGSLKLVTWHINDKCHERFTSGKMTV